jgi:hypothetical protein
MKFILLPFLLLFFISCAQEQKTNANVSVRLASSLNGDFAGSLILMGKHAQTNETFFKEVGANGISIDLKNGDWTFAAMGWEGGTNGGNFTGKSYCDVKPNINLSGGILELSFTATTAKCSLDLFGGANAADADKGFKQLIINSCIDIKRSFSTFYTNGDSPENKGCGMTEGPVNLPEEGSERYLDGTHQYFKISMFGKIPGGGFTLPISSGCLTKQSLKTANSEVRLPMSSGALPISYQIESFYNDPVCSGQSSSTYTFINGFYQRDLAQNALVHNDNEAIVDDLQLEVFLHEPGCLNAGAAPDVIDNFSLIQHQYGTANKDSKYLICNRYQLILIDTAPESDAKYFLGNDLDSVAVDTITIPEFKGSFRGDGHIISGITVPLFQKIKADDASNPVEISDIIIDNAQVDIFDATPYGALAKDVISLGSAELSIENIVVKNNSTVYKDINLAPAEAFKAGGLIGQVTNQSSASNGLTFKNVHSKATIDTTANNEASTTPLAIGGLFGQVDGEVFIKKSSFEGNLLLKNLGNSDAVMAGGLIGKIGNSTAQGPTLERVAVNILKLNELNDYQQTFGGIIGRLEAGTAITVRDTLLKVSIDVPTDFNIKDYKLFTLVGSFPATGTINLTIDGFVADVRDVDQADFYTSVAHRYIIPTIPSTPVLSFGPIITGGIDPFYEKIAIIHPNLNQFSGIDFTGPVKVKQYFDVQEINTGYFSSAQAWNLDVLNDKISLRLLD